MKIFCIGRNYIDHAKELQNPVPTLPLVFMKPASALLKNNAPFYHPDFSNDIHYELELVLKVGKNGKHISPAFAEQYIKEIAVGVDMTARDLQSELKKKGHPWEIAKGFDNSAIISEFRTYESSKNWHFSFHKNGSSVQEGQSKDMIFSFTDIICHLSKYFSLQQGDLIYTGTPAGVGPIKIGDRFEAFLEDEKLLDFFIK